MKSLDHIINKLKHLTRVLKLTKEARSKYSRLSSKGLNSGVRPADLLPVEVTSVGQPNKTNFS